MAPLKSKLEATGGSARGEMPGDPAVRPEVTVRIVRKVYPAAAGQPGEVVLCHVAIDLAPASFTVVTGPSGCGKSTLLNIVAGLDHDFEGQVTFAKAAPALAFVFQTPRLLPWRTVRQNIALALPTGKAAGNEQAGRVADMIARVGLTEAADAFPERISLGMQRRASLARAFIVAPDILVMDEPFVSLDDPAARDLRRLLVELWRRRPTTVLFVTHDRAEAVELGSRILRLGGASASILGDTPVTLSPSERTDAERVRAEQMRIFGPS